MKTKNLILILVLGLFSFATFACMIEPAVITFEVSTTKDFKERSSSYTIKELFLSYFFFLFFITI